MNDYAFCGGLNPHLMKILVKLHRFEATRGVDRVMVPWGGLFQRRQWL
jgi:hypothetical protein